MILDLAFASPRRNPNIRAVYKALSWRVVGAADTFLISFFVTGNLAAAGSIMGIEILTKIFLYWAHDRAWDKAAPVEVANKA